MKFQVRPPAKQNLTKFKNPDNHVHKYLIILKKITNFQKFPCILRLNFSTRKAKNAKIRVVPKGLGTRLLRTREIDFFHLRTKILSPKSKSNRWMCDMNVYKYSTSSFEQLLYLWWHKNRSKCAKILIYSAHDCL